MFVTNHRKWVPSLRCNVTVATTLSKLDAVASQDLVVIIKTVKHKLSLPYTNAAKAAAVEWVAVNTGTQRMYRHIKQSVGIDLEPWGYLFWRGKIGQNLMDKTVDIAVNEGTKEGRERAIREHFVLLGGDPRKAPTWKNIYDFASKYDDNRLQLFKEHPLPRGKMSAASATDMADKTDKTDKPDKQNGRKDDLRLMLAKVMGLMEENAINGITLVAGERPLVNRVEMRPVEVEETWEV